MTTKTKPIYALGIVAHPDDESFLFAGTSLMLASEGKKVGVVSATKGEMGADRLNRKLSKKQMAVIRLAEGKKAGKIIKLTFVDFLNHPDGGLEQINFNKFVKELVKKIEQHRPKIVLTFGREGISGHRDHIAIHRATVAAVKQARHKPDSLLLASLPSSAMPAFNKHLLTRKVHHSHFKPQPLKGVADNKLLKIDIGKFAKQKHKALKAHESQYLPSFVLDVFQKYECFEVIMP
ncbi:MAG: PIG-L family deacetylase [Candidatus Doudnabacteria bacterium]